MHASILQHHQGPFGFLRCIACCFPTPFSLLQYLEELGELEALKGAAALPGKRGLVAADAADAGVGVLGRDALRSLVRRQVAKAGRAHRGRRVSFSTADAEQQP